ncbi:MAG: hypothetical protein ABL970_11270 [Nitrospira sp.]
MAHIFTGWEDLVSIFVPGLQHGIQIATHHNLSRLGGFGVFAVELNGDKFVLMVKLNLVPFQPEYFTAPHPGPVANGSWYFGVLWQGLTYLDEVVPRKGSSSWRGLTQAPPTRGFTDKGWVRFQRKPIPSQKKRHSSICSSRGEAADDPLFG